MKVELHSTDTARHDSDLTEWGLIIVIVMLALIAAVPAISSLVSNVLSRM